VGLVDGPGGVRAVVGLVLVAPVTRDAQDADGAAGPHRPAGRADPAGLRLRIGHHPVDEVGQLTHPVDVVAVVDDRADSAHLDEVQPARSLEEGRRERAEALADVVKVCTRCQAPAAAARAFATFIRARPPNVAGMRCV